LLFLDGAGGAGPVVPEAWISHRETSIHILGMKAQLTTILRAEAIAAFFFRIWVDFAQCEK
jgi:hypothetical protein